MSAEKREVETYGGRTVLSQSLQERLLGALMAQVWTWRRVLVP